MADIDPGEYDVAELTAKVKDIEDPDVLREILEAEEDGEDRAPIKAVLNSRIEKFTEDEEAPGDLDPTELTVAELGNQITSIDDVDQLEAILEMEEDGDDRKTAKRLIEQRLDSVRGSEGDTEIAERAPPEERHPDLDHPTADKQYVSSLEDGDYQDMWVYCETQAGDLVDVSREMLGKARELMDGYNEDYGVSDDESEASETSSRQAEERVVAVLIGDDVEQHAEECIECGADLVVYQEDDRLNRFLHTPFTEIFCQMARAGSDRGEATGHPADWKDYDEPRYAIFPATNNGRDLSALVQGELDSGLASDCSDLYIEDAVISNPAKTGGEGNKKEFEAVLHMPRPDFSGFEYSTILCLDNPSREFHPQGGSVIPGSFEIPDPDPTREGEVVEFDAAMDDGWFDVAVTEFDQLDEGVDLTGHDVIVALGRGIGDDPTKGMELGLDLVQQFEDADLGITRGIVTSSYEFEGHVEQYAREERQLGETGQVVEPELYIAAGISGAIQHKVGVDESETIIAINTDPDADIRDFSDYFIEGDLFDVLPGLIDALEAGELDAEALGGQTDD